MKKFIVLILLIICGISLQRDNDYTEISEMTFVNSMGFDFNEETSEYVVYLYIINNFNLSLSQFALGSDETMAYIVKGVGKSITDALNMIKSNTSIYYRFSSMQTIVIKNTFFQGNRIKILCEFLIDSVEIYPNFMIMTTSDEIMDIYQIGNFAETSSYYTLLVNSTTKHDYLKIYFNHLCNDVFIKNCTIFYPSLKVEKEVFFDQKDHFYSISINGISVINNDNQLSTFTETSLPSLYLLTPLNNSIIHVDDFDYQIKRYRINYSIKNDALHIKIKIRGYSTNNPDNLERSEIEDDLYRYIATNLFYLKETFDSYQIDLFNINYISNGRLSYQNCQTEIYINNRLY